MIGYIEGVVKAVIRDSAVVSAGPVGYRIRIPAAVLARLTEGDTIALFTHLAVREHAHELYGFEAREELQWFELLLTVSGVGPRSALAIMNSADTGALEEAIAAGDAGVLSRAFGIGRKTAEKIVLELREKVGPRGEAEGGTGGDAVEALVSLGYSLKEARDTMRAVPEEIEGTEARLREALRLLGGGR